MTNTKEYLNHAIEQADGQSVTVAALMCGMGKSTYISERIAQTLSSRTTEGMLIVTDEVQRMHSYLEPHDAAVRTVIQRHKGKVVVMSQENADEAQRRSWNAPVLIITTQRYFRLTRKEIKQLLKWSAGQRELIGEHLCQYPVYSGQTENQGIMGCIESFDYEICECLFTTTVGAKVMTPRILHGNGW